MKIRLHQTFGAHAGRTRELDQDVITFGRLPSSDVAFDPHADLDASGSHAEIRREGNTWVLRDSGSRNGTLVGGRPVSRHELIDGDEIEFGTGGPRIRVELIGGATSPSAPAGTLAATPILGAPLAAPSPASEKKYGQATLDAAVEAAAAKARADALANLETQRAPKGTAVMQQSPGSAPLAPAPYVAPPLAPTGPAPAAPDGSGTVWMIAAILALFVFLSLCLVSCVVLGWLYSAA